MFYQARYVILGAIGYGWEQKVHSFGLGADNPGLGNYFWPGLDFLIAGPNMSKAAPTRSGLAYQSWCCLAAHRLHAVPGYLTSIIFCDSTLSAVSMRTR